MVEETQRMRNQWIGDIGDFGKYGLLRVLCPGLKLGVVWYLVSKPDTPPGKIDYLSPECDELCQCRSCRKNRKLSRACDEGLWDTLRKLVRNKQKSVGAIRDAGILNENGVRVTYYEDELTSTNRLSWVPKALEATSDCDVVFLDPDTGLEPPTRGGLEHVRAGELEAFWEKGKRSVVLYQQFWQQKPADASLTHCEEQIKRRLKTAKFFPLRYKPRRWFVIIPAPQHYDLFLNRVASLQETNWCKLNRFVDLRRSDAEDLVCPKRC